MPTLSLIAAVARNGAIGANNALIYHLPNDLKHFKALTTGHTIVMGRRTFESLPNGALPHRCNIVLSRTLPPSDSYEVCASLQEVLACCDKDEEIFIIGGAAVYAEALPLATRLYLTHIEDTPQVADVFFPPFDADAWVCVEQAAHPADERHAHAYAFATYRRK